MCSVSSEPSHNSSRHIMVKAKIYIGTEPKCTKSSKQSSAIKQFLETLLLAIKMCIGFTADVIWLIRDCVMSLANCVISNHYQKHLFV